ncbi:hypothetical protein BC834DRAFT_282631 [Gloeopeniophorella convolvens]|nr:hypothetical protein BC834DRAFT_282631 [Gloeopeniophorella convolvens]
MSMRNSNEDTGEGPHANAPILKLPEDALLAIFETWQALDDDLLHPTQPSLSEWYSLTHVCRSWRHVIHEHARHLGLRLSFTYGMPVKEMLGSLPPWPIALNYDWSLRSSLRAADEEGILHALQHPSRLQEISLHSNPDDSLLEQFIMGMTEPLPGLEFLRLHSGENRTTLPATFAGHSTPDLQTLLLDGFTFHSIPPFLVSATGLKHIDLRNMHGDTFAPTQDLVACLSSLTRLEKFTVEFESAPGRPTDAWQALFDPSTLAVLPNLIELTYKGPSAYLEALLAAITTPLLETLRITFFHQLTYTTPRLSHFVRSLGEAEYAWLIFAVNHASINFRINEQAGRMGHCFISLPCKSIDWQISSVAQVTGSLEQFTARLERLNIDFPGFNQPTGSKDVALAAWYGIFRGFASVRTLRMCVWSGRDHPLHTQVCWALIQEDLESGGESSQASLLPALSTLELSTYPGEEAKKVIGTMKLLIAARERAGKSVVLRAM